MGYRAAIRRGLEGLSRPGDLLSGWAGRRVHYVLDSRRWVVGEIGHSLVKELRAHAAAPLHETRFPWLARHQVLYFANRYQFIRGPLRWLSPTNQVIVAWYHGDPSDPSPVIRALFAGLRQTGHRIDTLLVSCKATRRSLVAVGVPPERIVRIPLGIDLGRFSPATPEQRLAARQQVGLRDDLPVLGSFQKDGLGWDEGLEPKLEKGPDVFLAVVERLWRSGERFQVLLTAPARGYVKTGLERLGVPYVHLSFPDFGPVAACYHALDAYLIGSRSEGGPMALLEAWASGVPVVTTRVGMAADALVSNHNGFMAEQEDVPALADHVGELFADPALCERLSRQALSDVAPFDWAEIAQRYWRELYLPALARCGGRAGAPR